MTVKDEVLILSLIEKDQNVHHGDPDLFYHEYKDELAGLSWNEVSDYIEGLLSRSLLDDDLVVTNGFTSFIESKRQELSLHSKKAVHETRQMNLTKFQVQIFWPMFIFALLGGVYSCIKIYQDSNKVEPVTEDFVTEQELKDNYISKDQLIDYIEVVEKNFQDSLNRMK